ncbi:hypothetical protein V466_27885 [Pseudomonas mandelii PD30]|uniref:DUF4935 domain-containing protein n=1 Tax=Pseudomonas mandelii PD30 TaxID=1419583 RepID=A0A059KVG1_9PSED|nr:PIN domain-containing protein [Pseudomonas mandelii]KDD65719.1 hypothetical protein V466_27885 [Pseudomonas mandelii PD30]
MELESKYVFIDTCIFEQNSFVFSKYALSKITDASKLGQIKLLISTITICEVRAHISTKSKEIALLVKRFQREAAILRSLEDLPISSAFAGVTASEIESSLLDEFDGFLKLSAAEILSVDNVSPELIFEQYFSIVAPFGAGSKRKEFADAFVLESLSLYAKSISWPINVISADADMRRYCESNPHFVYHDTINSFLNILNHALSVEPAAYADQVFEYLLPNIVWVIEEMLDGMNYELEAEEEYVSSVSYKLKKVDVVNRDLAYLDEDHAAYGVDFEFEIEVHKVVDDVDNSPYDPERGYINIEQYEYTTLFRESMTLGFVLSLEDRIISRTQIVDIEDAPDSIELSNSVVG